MAINPDRPLIPPTPAAPQASEQAKAPVPTVPVLGADQVQATAQAKGLPAILTVPLPSQASYDQAKARLQTRVDADLALQNRDLPRKLYLRQNYETQFLSHPQPPAKGTVIMLHGYTAGPWQFEEAAARFHQAGYNVYAPRLPGHGMMSHDGSPSGEEMVDPWNIETYEKFIDAAYQEVAALGGPVNVVGLSGGSNIALRMAEKYPQIKGVVAMAPYLGPSTLARTANNVINSLSQHSFIKLPRLLDLIPYNKNVRSAPDYATPHTQGSLGNAQAMLSVGTRVDKLKVPVQFFTTEGDALAGKGPVARLHANSAPPKAALKDVAKGWYHFPAAEKVPHAMASPKQYDGANAIWDQVFESIDGSKAARREPENK